MTESISPPSDLGLRRGDGEKGWMVRAGWAGWAGKNSQLSIPRLSRLSCPSCLFTQPLVDFGPVDDVPPRVDVFRPAILVLQVVGVLPHVDAEDDLLVFHQRAVLVRAAFDHELAALIQHPRPPAAEAADARLLHFVLELVEAPERRVDRARDRAGRRAAGFWSHDLPEHRVVGVAAAVVADGGANVLWHTADAAQQILNALRLQLGMLLEGGVQVGDVRLMMLAVMNLHRPRIDVRLECIEGIWKGRKGVSHRTSSLCASSIVKDRRSYYRSGSGFNDASALGGTPPCSDERHNVHPRSANCCHTRACASASDGR